MILFIAKAFFFPSSIWPEVLFSSLPYCTAVKTLVQYLTVLMIFGTSSCWRSCPLPSCLKTAPGVAHPLVLLCSAGAYYRKVMSSILEKGDGYVDKVRYGLVPEVCIS